MSVNFNTLRLGEQSKLRFLLMDKFAKENCPCKNCEGRFAGCQSKCERNSEYQKRRDAYRKEIDLKITAENPTIMAGYKLKNKRRISDGKN